MQASLPECQLKYIELIDVVDVSSSDIEAALELLT
jgi:hypothetical protein